MNKHIESALSKFDFDFGKNKAYGHIEGYEVNVFNNATGIGPVFFISTYLSQEKKNEFVRKLIAYKFKLVQANYTEFGVVVVIGAMTAGSFEKKFPEVCEAIFNVLKELEAPKADICPQSGEPMDDFNSKIANIGDAQIKLTKTAIDTINTEIETDKETIENMPNNYLKGFFGILLGGLAGVIIAVILFYVGYISWLAPVVSIFLGVFLYQKFGGKQNAIMIVMSFLVTLCLILLSVFVLYYLAALGLALADNVEYRGMEAFNYCYQVYPEFKEAFVHDILLNIVFIALAEGFSIYRLVQMVKRPSKIN